MTYKNKKSRYGKIDLRLEKGSNIYHLSSIYHPPYPCYSVLMACMWWYGGGGLSGTYKRFIAY